MAQADDVASRTLSRARAVRDLARQARALRAELGAESPNSLWEYAEQLDAYAQLLEEEAAKAGACGPAA
jgi:hypothetical protein